jgi:hypothetical protein
MGPTGGLFATGSGDLKARIWRVSRQIPTSAGSGTPSNINPAHPHHSSSAPPQGHSGHRESSVGANWDRRKSLVGHPQNMSAGQNSSMPPSPAQGHAPQGPPQPQAAPQSQAPPPQAHAQIQQHAPAKPQNLTPVMALPIAKPAITPPSANSPTGNGNRNIPSPRIPPMQHTGPPPSPTRGPAAPAKSPVPRSAPPPTAEMDTTD